MVVLRAEKSEEEIEGTLPLVIASFLGRRGRPLNALRASRNSLYAVTPFV